MLPVLRATPGTVRRRGIKLWFGSGGAIFSVLVSVLALASMLKLSRAGGH